MIEKIILKLFYCLLILFPTGLLLRFKLFSNTSIVPQDIVVFVILVLTFLYYFKEKKFPKNNFFKFHLLFLIAGTLSLVVNLIMHPDIKFLQSFLYSLRYIAYLSLLIAPLDKNSMPGIKKALIWSGTAVLLIGFWQFFFYYDLYSLFYLGWDDHLYRMFSTFLDPNFAGVFFILLFFLLLGKIIKENFIHVYKEIIFSFFTLVALYLTFSRTALVALAAGLITFTIVTRKYKAMFITFLVLVVFLFIISDTHVEGLNPLRTASTSKRIDSYKESVEIISKNSFIGVGFNAFRYAQVRYGYRNQQGASWSNADAGTDNSLLFAFVTTGIRGLFFYIAGWYFMIKNINAKEGKNRVILLSSLTALFIGSMFTNILFYTPILTFWFLTLRVEADTVKAGK